MSESEERVISESEERGAEHESVMSDEQESEQVEEVLEAPPGPSIVSNL